jgi:hypothetical protein
MPSFFVLLLYFVLREIKSSASLSFSVCVCVCVYSYGGSCTHTHTHRSMNTRILMCIYMNPNTLLSSVVIRCGLS